uniref:SRCR domain-containing protein n=1 Tax=Heterorhabditis bacteriophora TaxID=37862 RepID=A0A1I7XKT6_HETBA
MLLIVFLLYLSHLYGTVEPQGQAVLDPGLIPLRQPIKNILGGVYSNNVTLFFRNSPYRVMSEITVEVGATLTIETGVQMYFDTGIGLKVKGAIHAIGNEFAHIQFLPYQQQLNYDNLFPDFRLIDGPSVRQGRLQVRFRDRWRSVCTMVTNWTSVDTSTACRSMGYSDGGAKSLWDCPGLSETNRIRLSENLCQGEDDLGIVCWGPPSFQGWAKHWKGLQIFNSPFTYVNADPDLVSVQKESKSRLEFIDILYAGYDEMTKNVTAALWIEGVAPIMNGLRIERSARDGMYIYEPSGPILIANSTFSWNRGHGIAVDNTTDGRVFINMTRIENNYGDGVWYRQKTGTNLLTHGIRVKRELGIYDEEKPRADICLTHIVPSNLFFPHLFSIHLSNGTLVDPSLPHSCWISISLPPRLPYTYSLQFLSIRNRNSRDTSTHLIVCDATDDSHACALERHRIPIIDGIYPQSISIKSSGLPIYLALDHQIVGHNVGYVAGNVDVLFRVHASVMDKAYYGLNITNSVINNNTGNGIYCTDIRERTALSNVTLNQNQGMAGFLVKDGAADIWLNDTRIQDNWGDGMNISYAGGSVTVNGTRIERNKWRGAAFHFNDSSPFISLYQEIIFKGKPSNNIFYLPTIVSDNEWGGILIGNFCLPASRRIEPKVLINWIELLHNSYHPALEIHSCQSQDISRTIVDVTGNRIEGNKGMGLRMAPSVNVHALISSNQFLNNNDTALFIKNSEYPQLSILGANVTISKNSFKFNRGKYIISIGLNEDAPEQKLTFNQQNEVGFLVKEKSKEQKVYTLLKIFLFHKKQKHRRKLKACCSDRLHTSNVIIHRNCFKNAQAEFEIGTELAAHAKWIDARENNWGTPSIPQFMRKIFDQFNRYSLAAIEVDPFAAVCNQRNPHITRIQEYFREFRLDSEPFILGGTIYENHDLAPGR